MNDVEQIKNWLRINIFRIWDAAEEGSLHAQYALQRFYELQENPQDELALEALPRHIDALEKEWERRRIQSLEDSRVIVRTALNKSRILRFILLVAVVGAAVGIAMLLTKILY